MTKQPFGDAARRRVSDAISTRNSPINDPERLAALKRTGLLDSPTVRSFDRLTRLASLLLRTPAAFVSLVDVDRQFFKSQLGLPEPWATRRETPLSHSFCRHVVEDGRPLIINDASAHDLVHDNPAIEELRIAAYAGIPLQTADGHVVGSFCVIDRQPRIWTPGEIGVLSELAASVMTEITLQTKMLEHQTLLDRFAYWCERLPIACFTCGPDMRIAEWNPEAFCIFGHAAQTVLGRIPHELLFPEEQRAEAEKLFIAAANCATFQREGIACIASDGHTVLTDWTFTPLILPGGEFGGFVAMVQDVTAHHRAEKELVALDSDLAQRQRLETLGTLSGGMAHEFGNILGAILGNADLARRQVGADHPVAKALGEILAASGRARELAQKILRFAPDQPAERAVLALRPIVEETARLLRATLPRSLNVVAISTGDVPNVLADKAQVEQAILNLVTSAWQSLQGQPGSITITLDAVTDAPGAPAGTCARIVVRDAGKGTDAAMLARIFEPRFSTKPSSDGTGVSVSIVHRIMQTHEGAIHASSQPGEGTAFTLYFPATASEPEATATQAGIRQGLEKPSATQELEDAVFAALQESTRE